MYRLTFHLSIVYIRKLIMYVHKRSCSLDVYDFKTNHLGVMLSKENLAILKETLVKVYKMVLFY